MKVIKNLRRSRKGERKKIRVEIAKNLRHLIKSWPKVADKIVRGTAIKTLKTGWTLINAVKCSGRNIKRVAIQTVLQPVWLRSCKKNGKAYWCCHYSRTWKEVKIRCYWNKLDGWN